MKRAFFVLVVVFISIVAVLVFQTREASQSPTQSERNLALAEEQKIPSSLGLERVVSEILKDADGTYGVVVKNLATNETFFLNAHRNFEPASLYKLWVMGTTYDQIQRGKLNPDGIIEGDTVTLAKRFGVFDGDDERPTEKISYSVRDAIYQMITISDNSAALLLTDKVGVAAIGTFLESQGMKESMVGVGRIPPITTPRDTALFLERLYQGKLVSQKYSEEMIDFLRWQKLNNGLPKLLPDEATVAHKTGELEPFTHDAGIVFSDFGDYIIVVFSETDSRAQAQERIANVSKAVYDYFAKQGN